MLSRKYAVIWKKTLSSCLMFSMVMAPLSVLSLRTPVVSAAVTEDVTKTDSEKFEEYTKEMFKEYISGDKMTNRLLVLDSEKYGVKREDVPAAMHLGYDEDSLNEKVESCKEVHKFLDSLNYENLTDEQKDLYDSINAQEASAKDAEKFKYYEKTFSGYNGIQTSLMLILPEYDFTERQDFLDYLELLKSLPACVEEALQYEQKRSELGLFMSDRELDQVIVSIQNMIADPENQILITSFNHSVDKFGLNNRDTIQFKKENRDIVLNQLIPAYQKAIEGLEKLRGTGIGSDDSLYNLPDGREYYQYLLHKTTGSNRSPLEYVEIFDQLSSQCVEEVKRINETTTMQNYITPSVKYLSGNPEDYLKELLEMTKEDFTPLEGIKFNIQYVDESLGQFAAPAYIITPQIDAKTEFNVYINPAYQGSASYDTVAHEAYPGHLYQGVVFNNTDKNPAFHMYETKGFSEGWAQHVQSMAYKYTDASPLCARKAQLVSDYMTYQINKLDILINYMGYTKAMTVQYLENLGIDKASAEYNYYLFTTVPASNMAYAGGLAEIELMVNQAQKELGNKFSYQTFHDFYLSYAGCTFETINKHFDQWLAEQKKAVK